MFEVTKELRPYANASPSSEGGYMATVTVDRSRNAKFRLRGTHMTTFAVLEVRDWIIPMELSGPEGVDGPPSGSKYRPEGPIEFAMFPGSFDRDRSNERNVPNSPRRMQALRMLTIEAALVAFTERLHAGPGKYYTGMVFVDGGVEYRLSDFGYQT